MIGATPLLTTPLILGLAFGAVIGAAAFLINFCALGGVADILFAKDWRRMRAWMLAAGVAMIATQGLSLAGFIKLEEADVAIPWAAIVCGGIMFGYGMALSGGCINRALVRLGAGSFKSLVIIVVVALTAAATQMAAGVSVPTTESDMAAPVQWAMALLCGGGLIAVALMDSWFRENWRDVLGSVVIGLAVAATWLVTTWLADPTPVNFVQSAGDLITFWAGRGAGRLLGVALLIGVPVGSFLAAAATRNLAWESFTDGKEAFRNIIGGVLMGAGGILAWGCTFGQGLAGLAMLGVTAPVAVLAMIFGCLWGIRAFEAGGVWAGLKLTITQLAKR